MRAEFLELRTMFCKIVYFSPCYAAPAVAPPNVRIVGATSTTLTVAWDPIPCLLQNIEIVDYRTHVGLASTGMSIINGARTVNSGLSYTATGLSPSTSYYFQVYSVTSANRQGMNAQRVTGQTLAPRESISCNLILYA